MDTKKYIIEIPDNTAWIQWVKVSDKDGHVCFDFKDLEDLTPYIEPDLDAVRKEAYDKGYQDATVKIGSDEQAIAEKAYQKGLNDAWGAARKILLSKEDGGLFGYEESKAVFGYGNYFLVLKKCSASEAVEKIRQYEQEEIKVGDEVEARAGKAVIIEVLDNGKNVRYMYPDASFGVIDSCNLTRTGRHFPEFAEVLRKMKEEES